MGVSTRKDAAGNPVIVLTHNDDEVAIAAFGGQILYWTKGETPIVFENKEHTVIDGKHPHHGGAPICFSYFGKGSLLPNRTTLSGQHGTARVSLWDFELLHEENAVRLSTQEPAPESYGPTTFSCELTYRLDKSLIVTANIQNVGENSSPFQFAIHTYWATQNPSSVSISGIGNRYLDNLLGLTEQQEDDSSAPHTTPFDRVYLDSENDQTLQFDSHMVEIRTQGCAGSVLWNPGPNHTISDIGSPDFVCLESGVIMPAVTLEPHECHTIEIMYQAKLA